MTPKYTPEQQTIIDRYDQDVTDDMTPQDAINFRRIQNAACTLALMIDQSCDNRPDSLKEMALAHLSEAIMAVKATLLIDIPIDEENP